MFWFASHNPSSTPGSDAQPPCDQTQEARQTLAAILPWSVSLLIHVLIVLLALLIPWLAQMRYADEESIIPDAYLSRTPTVPLQMRATKARLEARTTRRTLSSRNVVSPAQSRVDQQNRLIGTLGAAAGSGSPFDMGIVGQQQVGVEFFGTGGNAYKIVYVIDASGSLTDTLAFVLNELIRSINQLNEQQSFTVIFYQGDNVKEIPPIGMRPAVAKYRQQVIKWITPEEGNIIPMLSSDPRKAIKRALLYRPDLLFLLSDDITGHGRYEIDQRQLLRAIKQGNKHNTKINTIQFIYPDPLEKIGFEPTMKLIATTSGGIYKFLDGRELGIE